MGLRTLISSDFLLKWVKNKSSNNSKTDAPLVKSINTKCFYSAGAAHVQGRTTLLNSLIVDQPKKCCMADKHVSPVGPRAVPGQKVFRKWSTALLRVKEPGTSGKYKDRHCST